MGCLRVLALVEPLGLVRCALGWRQIGPHQVLGILM
jgi:hypothetical protein